MTIEDVEAALPTIKEKYQLETIKLIDDGDSEYHVEATINPRRKSKKRVLFKRSQIREIKKLSQQLSRHIRQKKFVAEYKADPHGFLLNPNKVQVGDIVEVAGLQDVLQYAAGLTVLRNPHLRFVDPLENLVAAAQAEMDFLILGDSSVEVIVSAKLNPKSFEPNTDRKALQHYIDIPLNDLGRLPSYLYANFGNSKKYRNVVNVEVHYTDEIGNDVIMPLDKFRSNYLSKTIVSKIQIKSLTPAAERAGDPTGDITTVATTSELIAKLAQEVSKLLA